MATFLPCTVLNLLLLVNDERANVVASLLQQEKGRRRMQEEQPGKLNQNACRDTPARSNGASALSTWASMCPPLPHGRHANASLGRCHLVVRDVLAVAVREGPRLPAAAHDTLLACSRAGVHG